MRARPGRHALLFGLVASALLHAVLLLFGPGMSGTGPNARRAAARRSTTADALSAIRLDEQSGATSARRIAARPVVTGAGRAAERRDSLAMAAAGSGGTGDVAAPAAARSLSERFRAPRDPALWVLPSPLPESAEERGLKRLAARLEEVRAELSAAAKPDRGIFIENGKVGVRIPFGKKPPGPAVVIPAPPRLASLAVDSARPVGDALELYYGEFTLTLPAVVRAGESFVLVTRLSAARRTALVRVFVDGALSGSWETEAGVARAPLTIATAGSHRILVHVLATDGYPPSQLSYVLNVGS